MTPEEFIRAKKAQPVREDKLGPGMLNPTQNLGIDVPFQSLGDEPALRDDLAEGDEEAVRIVLRGRVLDTYGKPIKDALVEVDQNGAGCACVTTRAGTYSLLVLAPEREPAELTPPPADDALAPPPVAPEAEDAAPRCVTVRVSKDGKVLLTTRLFFNGCDKGDEFYHESRLLTETGDIYAQKDLVIAC